MYNMMYFEDKEDYKIIGEYCIHRYAQDDLFDSIFDEEGNEYPMQIGYITKHDCNHIVAWIYKDHIEKAYHLKDFVYHIHVGANLLNRIDTASNNDSRALKMLVELLMLDDTGCNYMMIYNDNDLLK